MYLTFSVSNEQIWVKVERPEGTVLTFSATGADWLSSRGYRLLSSRREVFETPELLSLWGEGPESQPSNDFVHIRGDYPTIVTTVNLQRPDTFSVSFAQRPGGPYRQYQPLEPTNPLRRIGHWTMTIYLPLSLSWFHPDLDHRLRTVLALTRTITTAFIETLRQKIESIRYPIDHYLRYLSDRYPAYFGPLTLSFIGSQNILVPYSPGCSCSSLTDPWGPHLKSLKHLQGIYPDLSPGDIKALVDGMDLISTL